MLKEKKRNILFMNFSPIAKEKRRRGERKNQSNNLIYSGYL